MMVDRCASRLIRKWAVFRNGLRLTLRSWLSMGADRYANAPTKHIICTDVPDPDNFLMVLKVLKNNPEHRVDINLSPRPVSFAAVYYGDKREKVLEAIDRAHLDDPTYKRFPTGIRLHLRPVTEANSQWVRSLEDEYKPWFYVDKDLNDAEVIEDTKLYLQVSWLRMVSFLDAHGIPREQYTFYWDKELTSSGSIKPGCHHASHKPDFTYDFDENLMARYDAAVAQVKQEGEARGVFKVQSQTLRKATRQLCQEYVDFKTAQLHITASDEYHDFRDLISKHQKTAYEPELLVGGPFTEAVRIVEQIRIKRVVAMAGFIEGSKNLFANQFNFMIDMDAARKVLHMARAGKIDLSLLPTECVKGSPYEISRDEFDREVRALSPESGKLYDHWDPNGRVLHIFDLLAVMAASRPELFTQKLVDLVDDGEVIRFVPAAPDNDQSKIKMFWSDADHMRVMRPVFVEEIRKTFT